MYQVQRKMRKKCITIRKKTLLVINNRQKEETRVTTQCKLFSNDKSLTILAQKTMKSKSSMRKKNPLQQFRTKIRHWPLNRNPTHPSIIETKIAAVLTPMSPIVAPVARLQTRSLHNSALFWRVTPLVSRNCKRRRKNRISL